EECPWPSDEISVRPLRDFSELSMRLSSETTAPPEMQLLRAAAGESMVSVNESRVFDTEPVYEPIYKRVRRAVYVLLDCSGSMFEDRGWKIRLAGSLIVRMMHATVDGNTTFMFRRFAAAPGPLRTIDNTADAKALETELMSLGDSGGTEIPAALKATIDDFKDDPLDEAEVMIVSDGEQEFDTGPIRGQLTKNNIRLHAVIFGTKNAALRKMADVYYEVLPGPTVSPPVYRTPPKPRKKH
ncbi:MAG: VWA domain-containing protein, partial [Patescibacteria group bacterium]